MASTNNTKITTLDELNKLSGSEWLPISAKQGISDELFNSYRVSVDAIKNYISSKYDINSLHSRFTTYYNSAHNLGAYTYDSYPKLNGYLSNLSTYVDNSITYLTNAYSYVKSSYTGLYNFATDLFGSFKLTGAAGTNNSYQLQHNMHTGVSPMTISSLGNDPKSLTSANNTPGIVSKNFLLDFADSFVSSDNVTDLSPIGGNPDFNTYGTVYTHDIKWNAKEIKHPIYINASQSTTGVTLSYRDYTYSTSSLRSIQLTNADNTTYGMVTLGQLCEYSKLHQNPVPKYVTKSYTSTYTYINKGLDHASSTTPDKFGLVNEPMLESWTSAVEHDIDFDITGNTSNVQMTTKLLGDSSSNVISSSQTNLIKSGDTTYGVTTYNYIKNVQNAKLEDSLKNTPKFDGSTYGVATEGDIETYTKINSPKFNIYPATGWSTGYLFRIDNTPVGILSSHMIQACSDDNPLGLIDKTRFDNKIKTYIESKASDLGSCTNELTMSLSVNTLTIKQSFYPTSISPITKSTIVLERFDYSESEYTFLSLSNLDKWLKTYVNNHIG